MQKLMWKIFLSFFITSLLLFLPSHRVLFITVIVKIENAQLKVRLCGRYVYMYIYI